jgi:hypothetical protein
MRWRTDGLRWAVATIGICVFCAEGVAAAPRIAGRWDATVVVNTVEVPFRFEIAQHERDVVGFFFEGSRKVASTSGRIENGALTLEYDFLNTILEARVEGDQLRGRWNFARSDSLRRGPPPALCRRSAASGSCIAPPRTPPNWTCPGGCIFNSPSSRCLVRF